jgi:ATP-dependent helicase/nuclease subunit B
VVLVPDRASLEAERHLLSALGGIFNIQVSTIRRYANRILPEYKYLSKQAALIALTAIIQDNASRLTCFKKGHSNAGFVESVYETICALKYCRISPEQLTAATLHRSIDGKIRDIALLYRCYQDFLATGLIDSADKLDLLCDAVTTDTGVANTFFYIYDFDNFSAQELQLIENLITSSLGVTVACTYSEENRYLYLNDIYHSLVALSTRLNIAPNIIHTAPKYSNKYTEQLGKYLYSYKRNIPKIAADDFVTIFNGATRVNEVYALACKIQQYVRSGGRFRDIYVITSDISAYTNCISTVFDQFNIPYYSDTATVLSDHVYAQYIVDYLSMVKSNFKLKSVLNFVKNPFFGGGDDVYLFENYCLKYNVNYNFREFKLGSHETELFAAAERIRARLWDIAGNCPFLPSDTAIATVEHVRHFIETTGLIAALDDFAAEEERRGLTVEAKISRQVAAKFDNCLVEIAEVLNHRVLKLDDFCKTLTTTLASVNVSAIPVYNDCVIFANMAKSRKHDIKFLALLGANHGQMPIIKTDSKLLCDDNLKHLLAAGINLEPEIHIENKRERFSLYQLLLEPTEQLFVSFCDSEGGGGLPSQFVTEIKSMFRAHGKEMLDTASANEDVYTEAQALSKLVTSQRRLRDNQIVKMPTYKVLYGHFKDKIDSFCRSVDPLSFAVNNGTKLFLATSETSITKITDFYECPYKFFFRYGLNVQPRVEAQLNTADLGIILHYVLEKYVSSINLSETDAATKKRARMYFDDYMTKDYYRALASDPVMKNILFHLRKEAEKMCVVVKGQLNSSDFVSKYCELHFGTGKDVAPVLVEFGGEQFLLKGVVDRVDTCGDNFIVIDYKSGAAASRYNEKSLYTGHKLQLLIYVLAVAGNFHLTPVGFYYFNMHNRFADSADSKVYTYGGRTLCDAATVGAIDKALLETGRSERLGVSLTKNGDLNRQSHSIVSRNQLDSQLRYAQKLVERAGTLMKEGYIAMTPYDGACEYCDYKTICDFGDTCTHPQRKVDASVVAADIERIVAETD